MDQLDTWCGTPTGKLYDLQAAIRQIAKTIRLSNCSSLWAFLVQMPRFAQNVYSKA